MAVVPTKRSIALLVGVGARDSDHPAMNISLRDARELETVLQQHCGFIHSNIHRICGPDATTEQVLGKLRDIAAETEQGKADTLILYFSGHGCVFQNEHYFVCHDTVNNNIARTSLSGQKLLETINKVKADRILVLLDCCHAGSVGKIGEPFDKGAFLTDHPNRVIISSCHVNQVSYLSKPVSTFTFALIEGITGRYFQGADKDVRIFDLAMYVRERVHSLSGASQQPQLDVLQNGATENFALVRYPNGKPAAFFKEDFRLADENDKAIDIHQKPLRDEAYRASFTQFARNIFNIGYVSELHVGTGVDKPTIKPVDEKTLEVSINGSVQTIPNELASLKELLGSERNLFQHGTTIYNIGQIHEATFNYITRRRVYNQVLTRTLMEIFTDYNDDAAALLESAKKRGMGWERKAEIMEAFREFIDGNTTTFFRAQFAALFAIGFKVDDDETPTNYIVQCGAVANRCIRLLSFILIARLWDIREQQGVPLTEQLKSRLGDFFTSSFRLSLAQNVELLTTLVCEFKEKRIEYPLLEIKKLWDYLQQDTPLDKAVLQLQHTLRKLEENADHNLIDCAAAEQSLSVVLYHFGFLLRYNMVSIKNLGYDAMHKSVPYYIYRLTSLRRPDADLEVETIICEKDPITTEAVILYDQRYTEGINLFPFVIDRNALQFEQQSDLFCFDRVVNERQIDFSSVSRNDVFRIVTTSIPASFMEMNEVVRNHERRKAHKLGMVTSNLNKAKKVLLD